MNESFLSSIAHSSALVPNHSQLNQTITSFMKPGSPLNKPPRGSQSPFIVNANSILASESYKKLICSTKKSSNNNFSGDFSHLSTFLIKEDPKLRVTELSKIEDPVIPVVPLGPMRLVGLLNIGNSCYMNSILQCLCHLSPFRDSVLNLQKSQLNRISRFEGKLAWSFKDLLENMRKSEKGKVIDPSDIKAILSRVYSQFSGYEQHDSAEFLRYFLEAFGQDCNKIIQKAIYQRMTGNTQEDLSEVADRWWDQSLSIENSLVTDLFQGQQISVITCQKCKFGSVSCEPFLTLHLPLIESKTSPSIQELLTASFQDSQLRTYKCENCKSKGKCKQQLFFHRFPKILVLHVKRFKVTSKGRARLDTEICINEDLELEKFRHQTSAVSPKYQLKGVSHHIGTLQFGHYLSEVKEERWYRLDDHKIMPIKTFHHFSSSAYLLFYLAGN